LRVVDLLIVIARSEATKQSRSSTAAGLLRFVRNDELGAQ
jgi:preprotein translocase subunit Sec61beta